MCISQKISTYRLLVKPILENGCVQEDHDLGPVGKRTSSAHHLCDEISTFSMNYITYQKFVSILSSLINKHARLIFSGKRIYPTCSYLREFYK